MSEPLSPPEGEGEMNEDQQIVIDENNIKDIEQDRNDIEQADDLDREQVASPILEEIEKESKSDERDELITIIVEIAEGKEEKIVVYMGDKAEDLAAEFCQKHYLNENLKSKLTANIQQNIEQALIELALEDNGKNNAGPPPKEIQKPLLRREIQESPIEDINEQEEENDSPCNEVSDPLGQNYLDLVEAEKRKLNMGYSKEENNVMEKHRKDILATPNLNTENRDNIYGRQKSAGKVLTSMPVHERLHIQAMNKQKAQRGHNSQQTIESNLVELQMNLEKFGSEVIDNKIMRPVSSNRSVFNYGDRLYQKGMKRKEEHEREAKEAKKEREIRERQEYSFRPTINKTSISQFQDKSNAKPEYRLMQKGQETVEKVEHQRTANLIENKLRCTFHPEINKK